MKKLIAIIVAMAITNAANAADNDSDIFQTLAKVVSMGHGAAAELAIIATNQLNSADIRTAAEVALRQHDTSATNSYDELSTFIRNWTITNEPPVNASTIALMKRCVELGHSAMKQLDSFSTDTNRPIAFRDAASQFIRMSKEQ